MLGRVRRLEQERMPEILAQWGGKDGLASFEAEVAAGIAEGRYDQRDAPDVLAGLMSWLV